MVVNMKIFLLLSLFVGCCYAVQRKVLIVGGYELTYHATGDDDVPFCEAISACAVRGAGSYLMKVDSAIMVSAIRNITKDWGYPIVWIGATDHYSEKLWTWLDGTTLSSGYTNWASGEPSDHTQEHHCAISAPNSKWDDVKCDAKFGYICQKDVSGLARSGRSTPLSSGSTRLGQIGSETASYWAAKAECKRRGTRLLQIDHYNIYKMVKEEAIRHPGVKFWVGERTIIFGKAEKCPAIDVDGWGYYNCSRNSFQYVCEAAPTHDLQISNNNPVVAEGDYIKIDCTASGFPLLFVSWYKEDEFVSEKNREQAHSTLIIYGAADLAGTYTCKATNSINGRTYTTTGFTNVKVVQSGGGDNDNSESCAFEGWTIPLIVILSVLVLVLSVTVFILLWKRCSEKNMINEPVNFANPAVFTVEGGRKA